MTRTHFKIIKKGLTDTSQAPRGKNVFYHCAICDVYVPSQPEDSVNCKCGNIGIDTEYIRLVVNDFANFTVVEKTG